MLTLIYSSDVGLISLKLNSLVNTDYKKYNYENNIETLIEQICQFNLFDDNKNILVKNLSFLKNTKAKTNELEFLDTLKNTGLNIYVTCNEDKINNEFRVKFDNIYELKKITKLTLKHFVVDILKKNDLILNDDLINLICDKLPTNAAIILSELNKLFMFNSNEINKELINELINEDISFNIFKMIENYVLDNKDELVKQLNYFIENKYDFYEIMNLFIFQIYTYKLYILHFNTYKNISLIIKDFNLPIFQNNFLIKLINNINLDKINLILNNLLQLNKNTILDNLSLMNDLKLFLLKGIDDENK